MTPGDLGTALGETVRILAYVWVIGVVLISLASPFLMVSIVRSLRNIGRQLERMNDSADASRATADDSGRRMFTASRP